MLSHLPDSVKANVSIDMTMAYREFDYETAKSKLVAIASELEYKYPKAASSLLEGLEETLTVHRLKVPGVLRETLCSTNPMESANSACRGIIRRVSNFRDGEMALRYAAAGYIEAERGDRRIKGYRQLPILSAMLNSLCSGTSSIKTA